jgi:glycosyltransferase involved in cell wall biosynthesis
VKIALVAPYFHPVVGGREQTVLYLAQGLAGRGHDVTVITTDRTPNGGKVKAQSENMGVSVRRIRSAYISFRVEIPLKIISLRDFDLIHIISTDDIFTFCFLVVAKFGRKPVVVTVFTPFALLKHPRKLLRPFLLVFEFLSVVSMRLANAAQAKNEIDLKIAKRFARKAELIPDGIPEHYFTYKSSIDFRKKYGLGDRKIILFVNRIHPLKGPQILINAMPVILKEHLDALAILIGPDSQGYTNELKKIAEGIGICDRVMFLGFVPEEEKIAAYDAADVVVIPSVGEFTEAFSIVLSEAWARNKTAVVTPSRALRSRVKPETGYIADCNPQSLAKNVIQAMKSPVRAPKVYSWNEVVDEYEKLYSETLGWC